VTAPDQGAMAAEAWPAAETPFAARIRFTFARELSRVARSGEIDALLLSTKNGLAPLGPARRFFAGDLGIAARELSELARWCHYENASVALVAVASRNPEGFLKGMVVAPAETARCYRQLAGHGGPGHDFRYRVWREAIAYAGSAWRTRCLAIDNFSLAESGIASSHLAGVRRLGGDATLFRREAAIEAEERGGAQVIHLAW